MTENEAIKAIQNDLEWHSKELKPAYKEVLRMAIQALEEIQQYRAIGLTPKMVIEMIESEKLASHQAIIRGVKLEQYEEIGTVEEFKALKEKAEPKEMDRYYCPICRHYFEDTDAYNYCPVCGQKMKSILE